MQVSTTCTQRLNRDVAELFSSAFNCSASHLTVLQTADSLNEPGSITLDNQVFEGPYRGGRFSFCFHIPANYPFKPVEVWATHPIWHPNIDLRSGKVAIPLEWSPVLTLNSFALAVQVQSALNLLLLCRCIYVCKYVYLCIDVDVGTKLRKPSEHRSLFSLHD